MIKLFNCVDTKGNAGEINNEGELLRGKRGIINIIWILLHQAGSVTSLREQKEAVILKRDVIC